MRNELLGKIAMEQVAIKEGICVQEVEKCIEQAIFEAIQSCKLGGNEQLHDFWDQVSQGKSQPTPAELVSFLSLMIAMENDMEC